MVQQKAMADLSELTVRVVEIARRVQRTWGCLGRYCREFYDQPAISLKLKARIFKT